MKIIPALLTAGLLLTSTYAFGQIRIGITGGVNYSTNKITNGSIDISERDFIAGLHVGLNSKFELNDNIDFRSGIIYSQRGYKYTIMFSDGSQGEGKQTLNYLDIPLLAGFKISEKMDVTAGPFLGILLSARDKVANLIVDDTEFINDFDFGLSAGVSFELIENLSADLRYIHGLTSVHDVFVFDDSGNLAGVDSGVPQNRTIQFSVTYLIR